MDTVESKIPTDGRAVRMDPDLASALDTLLEPHTGAKLAKAQKAVLEVRKGGATGMFHHLVETYRAAIADAVK
jgi:hypothetical protein